MSARTVDIKIKTTADNAGIDKTTKSLDNLDNTQGKVNKTATASKAASVSASQGFASVGQAASAAATGGVGSLSAALGGLTQQMPTLAKYAGPVGLIGAAAVAWKEVADAIREAQERQAQMIDDIQRGNIESRIKSITEQYAAMRKELIATFEQAKMLSDFEQAKDDAQTAMELAQLERKALIEKGKDPNNIDRSRMIDVDLSADRAKVMQSAEDRKFSRAARDREIEKAALLEDKANAESNKLEQIDQIEKAQAKMAKERADASSGKEKITGSLINRSPLGMIINSARLKKIDDDLAKQLEALLKTISDATAKAQAQDDLSRQAGIALEKLDQRRELTEMNKGVYNVNQSNASMGIQQTKDKLYSDQRAKLESEVAAAQKSADGIRQKRSELKQSSTKEWGDYTKSRRDGAGTEEIKKQLEEYREANALLRQYFQESSSLFTQNNQDIKKALETIRNLP